MDGDRDLYEIQFADGIWMLVREDDLVSGTIDVPDSREKWPARNGLAPYCCMVHLPADARKRRASPLRVDAFARASDCMHPTRSPFSRPLGLHTRRL